MSKRNQALDDIVRNLEERAKELRCLYSVGEILRSSDIPWESKLGKITEVIPPGWQYPEACEARITFADRIFQSPGFKGVALGDP